MAWLAFSYSLPSKAQSSPRVALWRRLRRLGAITLFAVGLCLVLTLHITRPLGKLRQATSDIAAGKLHPFAGPIRDNEGKEVLPKGRALADAQILEMNFLADGVVGKIAR